jgi:hypothetical protein
MMILAAMLPFTAAASSHDATRSDAKVVITNGDPIDFGTFWEDANGGIHIRDMVTIDEITGGITGTSTSTQNVDVICEGDACPATVNVWGSLSIVDETGTWDGRFVQTLAFAPGEEDIPVYDQGYVTLTGSGGYANMSFFGRITETNEADATVEGAIFTMATPVQSLNLSATLCAGEETWSGSYLSSGVIDGSGEATGVFVSASSEVAHDSNIYGKVQIANAAGTATLEFVAGGQDLESADSYSSHAFGSYIITGGTGAYADLYGLGRVVGTASSMPGCASGFGAQVQFIGAAHMN